MKNNDKNALLVLKKNGKYENLVIILDNEITFEVKYAFYNRKLAYKVKKHLEEVNHETTR